MIKKLSELKPGDVGVIVELSGGNPVLKRRIMEMGMTKGVLVKVVRNAPLKDPVEFEVRGYHLSLKRKEAEMIIVEVVQDDSSVHGSRGKDGEDNRSQSGE
jgi:Fe2+ transport system protein FeoA